MTYVENPRLFMCPTGYGTTWQDFDPGGTVSESSSSYTYVPGYLAWMPGDLILAYERSDASHGLRGRCVLFLDAHAEWWPAPRQAELRERLAKQQDALRRWREAGARPEDAGRFFGGTGAEPPGESPK